MFAFDRSPFAVLLPLALLLAVVTWSHRPRERVASAPVKEGAAPGGARDQTVAANLPSR